MTAPTFAPCHSASSSPRKPFASSPSRSGARRAGSCSARSCRAWVDEIPDDELVVHYSKAVDDLDDDDLSMLAAWHASLEVGQPIANKEFLLGAFPGLGEHRREALKIAAGFRGDEAFEHGISRGAGARHRPAVAVRGPRDGARGGGPRALLLGPPRLRELASPLARRIAAVAAGCGDSSEPAERPIHNGGYARVTKVTDGDTLQLGEPRPGPADRHRHAGGLRRRPSASGARRPSSRSACCRSARACATGVGVEERDRYGRLLAYVWLPDGRMLNRVMVEQGLRAAAHDPAERGLRRRVPRRRRGRRARPGSGSGARAARLVESAP